MTAAEVRARQRRGTIALASREVRRVVAIWTQTFLPQVVSAVIFLTIFGRALGGRIGPVEGVAYDAFILPGLLVVAVATQAFHNNASSLYQAKSEGYVDDLLTSPLRAWQLAAGYAAGGFVRSIVTAAAITVVTLPFVAELEDAPLVLVSLVLCALVFASLGVIVGIWAETFDQHAGAASLVVAPLALLGGVFYSARTLPEPWSTLTRIDPLYYLVDATRAGFTGVHESSVALSLALAAAAAATSFTVAAALLARGWRLKP